MDLQIQLGVIQPSPSPFETLPVPPSPRLSAGTVIDMPSLGGQGAPAGGTVDFYVCFAARVRSRDLQHGGGAAVGISRTVRPLPDLHGKCFEPVCPERPGSLTASGRIDRPSRRRALLPRGRTPQQRHCSCFEAKLARPTLTLNKDLRAARRSGSFDLVIDGATAKSALACGGTTGPIEVSAGPHKIRESAVSASATTRSADRRRHLRGGRIDHACAGWNRGRARSRAGDREDRHPEGEQGLHARRPRGDGSTCSLTTRPTLMFACGTTTGQVTWAAASLAPQASGTCTNLGRLHLGVIGGGRRELGSITLSGGVESKDVPPPSRRR